MPKFTAKQIAEAMAIVEAAKKDKVDEKQERGPTLKAALDYLCWKAYGLSLSDIFTSTENVYKCEDGTLYYGTGKLPDELKPKMLAKINASNLLKQLHASPDKKERKKAERQATAMVKADLFPGKPKARKEMTADELKAWEAKVEPDAQDTADDFRALFAGPEEVEEPKPQVQVPPHRERRRGRDAVN